MPIIKELLVEELQGLLDAENQLVTALPKMAKAAHHPKLKEAFEKHLQQTKTHVQRLENVFGLMGESGQAKPCRAMTGLVEAGAETIQEGQQKEPLAADLALIVAAQKVEHYEIAGYGSARELARLAGAPEAARLLSYTLGEEESADFLLTALSSPLLQQALLDDMGAETDLETVPSSSDAGVRKHKSAR